MHHIMRNIDLPANKSAWVWTEMRTLWVIFLAVFCLFLYLHRIIRDLQLEEKLEQEFIHAFQLVKTTLAELIVELWERYC